jgi:hypothetical protein
MLLVEGDKKPRPGSQGIRQHMGALHETNISTLACNVHYN